MKVPMSPTFIRAEEHTGDLAIGSLIGNSASRRERQSAKTQLGAQADAGQVAILWKLAI